MDKKINFDFNDVVAKAFSSYAKYIIQDRALPDGRDGLKPVQRRIIYAMMQDKNTDEHPYKKSVKAVGQVISNYHPHGDSSVYEAMVRMSQAWKNNIPLIDMQGNNGSIDDDPAAAMRYTEARLSKISAYLTKNIDKNTVEFIDNFDNSSQEPTVLPLAFCNLLLNGISGIAAAYATSIAPHNFNELIDACIFLLQKPSANTLELMKYIVGPDFPTGGIIERNQEIFKAFDTGKGKITIRAKSTVHKLKTKQQIIIDQIPYEVNKANLVKRIDEIRLSKKIDGILEIRDESDRNGLKIVIDVSLDFNPQIILNYLYKNSDLQSHFHYNMVAIVDHKPVLLNLKKALEVFLAFRRKTVVKAAIFDISKLARSLEINQALIKVTDIIDQVIHLIRTSKNKAESIEKLMNNYQFSFIQAEAIVNLRLYRLSNSDIDQLNQEIIAIQKEMEHLNLLIEDGKYLRDYLIKDFQQLRKMFDSPRRSIFKDPIDLSFKTQDLISKEDYYFSITKDGYVKRVSVRSYNASDNNFYTKENDQTIAYGLLDTHSNFVFFTSNGHFSYLPFYKINEYKWKDVGEHLNNHVKIDAEQKIVKAYSFNHFNTQKFLMVSDDGMGFISEFTNFNLNGNRTFSLMKLNKSASLLTVLKVEENDEILLITNLANYHYYSVAEISLLKLKAKGIKLINLAEGEKVVAVIINPLNAKLIYVETNNGHKKIKTSDLILSKRVNTKKILMKLTKNNQILQASLEENVDLSLDDV